MNCRRLIAIFMVTGLCTACSSIPRLGGPPSVAMGHLGQVVSASSETRQGQSLVDEAIRITTAIKNTNQAMLRDLVSRDFITAKRRIFDIADIAEPRQSNTLSQTSGLRRTVERALLHTELAARSADADESIRRSVPAAWQRGSDIMENIETLSTYINLGLSENTPGSLTIIAEEIDDITSRISGNIPGSYGLYDLERDLELAIAESGNKFVRGDDWYLKHFTADSNNVWVFESRPVDFSQFNSDNNNNTSSGGGDDDDDDDDDDD